MKNNPIGVLDSGIGGLTVLQEIVRELPEESFIYIGDSKNTPYGSKSSDEIYKLARQLVAFLLTKQVKLIIIACNVITVNCLDKFRKDYPEIPFIGTVPVVKTAAAVSQSKRIGILSTTGTAQSPYQKKLIATFASNCTVSNYGTDALVPFIEQGRLSDEELATVLRQVLTPFQTEKIDTLALGCTHFPFLKKQIQEILGDDVRLLDSGGAVARQVKRVLQQNNVLAEKNIPKGIIYTTGNIEVAKKLLHGTMRRQNINFEGVTLKI